MSDSAPSGPSAGVPPPPALPSSSIQGIREVFGYIIRHKGQVFVLKVDDVLLKRPLFSLLVKDIVAIHKLGVKIVLVPGAKHSIDEVLKTYHVGSSLRDEVRITSDEAMPLVKLGASNVTNALISLLSENRAPGVVGNWVRARAIGVLNGVDYLNTGRVEKVDVPLIENMLEDGLIPIMPNIGWNAVGKAYNLSSNELAVATAKALRASKLFFIGEERGIPVVSGVDFVEPEEAASGFFSNLDMAEGQTLLRDHADKLALPHRELVGFALEACRFGVDRVHVIDGSRDGIFLQEIFSSSGHGTMFYANQYSNIRPASIQDIPEILRIMQPYVDKGVLVQRSAETIGEDLEKYFVYKVDDTVHGCGALRPFGNDTAELEALVVEAERTGRGTGRKLASFLVERARKMGIGTVFLLTTQTTDFFMRMGFREASVDLLPPERRGTYNRLRNSRVLAIET